MFTSKELVENIKIPRILGTCSLVARVFYSFLK